MRIAVVNLTSGGLSGGYRKYLARLMPLLASDPRVHALSVFVPEGAAAGIERGIDVRTWPKHAGRRFPSLVRDVVAGAPDVVFVPTARHAEFGNIPVVTMVRNMEPLTVPFGGNTWAEGMKNVARAWEARRACRRAARVIAVSEHVRDFIVSRWQIDRDRVGTGRITALTVQVRPIPSLTPLVLGRCSRLDRSGPRVALKTLSARCG